MAMGVPSVPAMAKLSRHVSIEYLRFLLVTATSLKHSCHDVERIIETAIHSAVGFVVRAKGVSFSAI